jgi:hypothetical protein
MRIDDEMEERNVSWQQDEWPFQRDVPRPRLTARDSNVGCEIRQTAPGTATMMDTTGGNLMKIKESV